MKLSWGLRATGGDPPAAGGGAVSDGPLSVIGGSFRGSERTKEAESGRSYMDGFFGVCGRRDLFRGGVGSAAEQGWYWCMPSASTHPLHVVRSDAQTNHVMARSEPGVVWGGPRNEVFPRLPAQKTVSLCGNRSSDLRGTRPAKGRRVRVGRPRSRSRSTSVLSSRPTRTLSSCNLAGPSGNRPCEGNRQHANSNAP